jgi:hypothetical protein
MRSRAFGRLLFKVKARALALKLFLVELYFISVKSLRFEVIIFYALLLNALNF